MRPTLLEAMRDRGGLISRREALRLVPHHVLDRAVSGGVVRRIHPAIFVLADLADDMTTLDRAALAYAPGGALGHTTALRVLRRSARPRRQSSPSGGG